MPWEGSRSGGWPRGRAGSIGPLLAAAIFAGLGVVPDVDVLVEGTHRLYTHSIAAVGLVAVLAAFSLRAAGPRVARRRLARCAA